MFIREVVKKNPGYKKKFVYHRLMESVRTPRGPRQRMLLNLGKLDIPKDEWKILANRIEEIFCGQETFAKPKRHIEGLARHYANILITKSMKSFSRIITSKEEEKQESWATIDLNSMSKSKSRTVGGEALGWYAFCNLRFPETLKNLGFTPDQIQRSALLVIGRLLHPASERFFASMARWGRDASAIGELMGVDFRHLSNNALYRASDLLMENHDRIEREISQLEKKLFSLQEKIILFDLTNTYFEGSAVGSEKALRGRSKEKRSDCPLLTLALVLDEDGFPKASRTFPGNVSEPGTLKDILQELRKLRGSQLSLIESKPTVVIDAGVGTKDNFELINDAGYHYISVSRTRPDEIPDEGLLELKTKSGGQISIKKIEQNGEVFLYCQNSGRMKKEESMRTRLMERFEEGLKNIQSSLRKPRGHKKYDDIMKRIGRLQEKNSRSARFYKTEVKNVEKEGRMRRQSIGSWIKKMSLTPVLRDRIISAPTGLT